MPATAALVIIAPVTDARNPMLTAMTEITLPCLCLCSITNINTPAAPWTNREEKRAQRKIQYHISVRLLSTVPWAQRLRTCCTDRLIMEWSPPSAFIFPGGRPPPSPRAPGGGGCEAPGAAAAAKLLQAAAAGQGCGAPGWALLLRPMGLRGGPLSASPRQPPPRRGDIEDSGRGRGGDPALSPRRPRARTRGGGGRCPCLSGAQPRRGDRARGGRGHAGRLGVMGSQQVRPQRESSSSPPEDEETWDPEEAAAAAASAAPAASLPTLRLPTLEEPPPPLAWLD